MKKLLAVLAVLAIVSPLMAQTKETNVNQMAQAESKKLGVTLDLSYMTRYVSHGALGFGQQGGLFETVIIDLWGSGFGIAVGHQSATASGYVDKSRFNYQVFYKNTAFKDSAFKMNYKFNWRYEHYYDRAQKVGDTQEWTLSFNWPELLGVEGLAPVYIFDYEHPAGSGYNINKTAAGTGSTNYSGAIHYFGLTYDWKVDNLKNPINLSLMTAYRDGLGGGAVDHDWTHVSLGIGTKFNLTENLTLIPAIYHQITMDKSINSKGDLQYAKVSLQYKF